MNNRLMAIAVAVLALIWLAFTYLYVTTPPNNWSVVSSDFTNGIKQAVEAKRTPILYCFSLKDKKLNLTQECENLDFQNYFCGIENIIDDKEDSSLLTINPRTLLDDLNSLTKNGCKGYVMDFKKIHAKKSFQLSEWIKTFKEMVSPKKLAIVVYPKAANLTNNPFANAQNYSKLCDFSDEIVLRTFGKHVPGLTKEGEMAPLKWVEEVLRYTLKQCPLHKIRVGLAAYGHDWTTKKQIFEKDSPNNNLVENRKKRSEKKELANKYGLNKFLIFSEHMISL